MISLLTPCADDEDAAGNMLLCKFRMTTSWFRGLLTNHGKSAANDTTSRLHAANILMAGRHQEAA